MFLLHKFLDSYYNIESPSKSIALEKTEILKEILESIPTKDKISNYLTQNKIKKSYVPKDNSINFLSIKKDSSKEILISAIDKKKIIDKLIYSVYCDISISTLKDLEKITEVSALNRFYETFYQSTRVNIERLFVETNRDMGCIRDCTLSSLFYNYLTLSTTVNTHYKNNDYIKEVLEINKMFVSLLTSIKKKEFELIFTKHEELYTFFYKTSVFRMLPRYSWRNVNRYDDAYSQQSSFAQLISLLLVKETFKTTYKVGKAVTLLFNPTSTVSNGISVKDVEKFVENYENAYKISGNTAIDPSFLLVEGNDISYYYNRVNYAIKMDDNPYETMRAQSLMITTDFMPPPGQLKTSCMRNIGRQNLLQIYAANPDNIKMLIKISNKGKILGRCITWHHDGKKYFDRIYLDSIKTLSSFYSWLSKNDYINIYAGNAQYTGVNHLDKLVLPLKNVLFDAYPYIDTMCYISVKDKLISNKYFNGTHYFLKSQQGGVMERFDNKDLKSISNLLKELKGLNTSTNGTYVNTFNKDILNTLHIPELNENIKITDDNIKNFNLCKASEYFKQLHEADANKGKMKIEHYLLDRYISLDSNIHKNLIQNIYNNIKKDDIQKKE